MKVTIRKMETGDAAMVGMIERASFSEPWPDSELEKAAANPDYLYIVAEVESSVVGYAGCTISSYEADITNIAVASEFRRAGIGETLLNTLCRVLKERNVTSVFLEVRESNAPARNLYEKIEFEQVGMRKNFYRKPNENAIIMKKDLSHLAG